LSGNFTNLYTEREKFKYVLLENNNSNMNGFNSTKKEEQNVLLHKTASAGMSL